MVNGMTVGEKLMGSCQDLLGEGVLSQKQYRQCVEAMDGGENLKKISALETKVFNESRDDKEIKMREFLHNIQNEIIEIFKTGTVPSLPTDTNYKKLLNLTILMNRAIDWVQKLSVERHQTVDQKHYDQLLYYFNKADSNRKELEKIRKQFATLEQKSENHKTTRERSRTSYISQRNITISLAIFVVICGIIIFLLYFI